MKRPALSAVLILCLAGATLPAAWNSVARAAKVPKAMLPSMSSGRYLPETTVMVRVDDRVIRAEDVRVRYYEIGAENRPKDDSLGRVQFLANLADKEVLALAARAINPTLEMEQRADMRRTTNTLLQNMLFQVMVDDSVVVSEDDVEKAFPQFKYDVRVRELLFEDAATAERVRRDLTRGRLSWSQAFQRHSILPDSGDGTLGWVRRIETTGEVAFRVFSLPVGSISDVVQDQSGFHVFQSLERRPVAQLPMLPMRRMIIRDLRTMKTAPYLSRMYDRARQRAGAAYDTTNLKWVATQFRKDIKTQRIPLAGVIAMNTRVPLFAPEDLQRVLVRDRKREFTVSTFLEGYKSIPPLMRRRILNVHVLQFYVDAMFLEPVLVEMALERGIDKDPRTVAAIEEHREKLLVERVFRDSIESRVRIDPDDVRSYYDQNPQAFQNKLTVRYAMIMRYDLKGIDSVAAALNAGAKAEDIVKIDRAAGARSSLTGDYVDGTPNQYSKILLEELRPGHATRIGPDSDGKYLVIVLLDRREAGTKTFQESEATIQDQLRATKADTYLNEFLERQRKKHRIELYSGRVMSMRFTDPILE